MVNRAPPVRRIAVNPTLARELHRTAIRLPHFENEAFYSFDLQCWVYNELRETCTEGFDSLIDQIKQSLTLRPHCVIVDGLEYDSGNKLFVAINRAFGNLVARPYEAPRAQLVHYIQPATDLPASRRGRYETEKLHTDTADWKRPVELISMVCIHADRNGSGRSQILDISTLRHVIDRELGTSALSCLESKQVPWQIAPYQGGGICWRSVLTEAGICWRRYTIDLALAALDTELPPDFLSTLNDFENIIDNTKACSEYLMCENELMFLDNYRAIHARTPVSNPARSNRLMIRSWIQASVENAIPSVI